MSVVLDRDYRASGRLGCAVWLIESPGNRALAERLRAAGDCDPNSAVFSGEDDESAGDAAIRIFPTVVEHHTGWTRMEFIGAVADAGVLAAFVDEGVQVTPTSSGFLVTPPEGDACRSIDP